MRSTLAILALGLLTPGIAHSHDLDVQSLDVEVRALSEDLSGLEHRQATGQDLVRPEDTSRTYEDAVVAHMLEDYDNAAERFYVLRSLLPEGSLKQETDWYLADSLLRAGHDQLAEDALRALLDEAQHAYAPEAAASLLELYATRRDPAGFASVYEELSALGLVASTAELAYATGRSWYLVGDTTRAREALLDIPLDASVAPRTQYLLATIDVVHSDLVAATLRFEAVAKRSIDAPQDRVVIDMAQLAVARLKYEEGDFSAAAEAYSRVGGDSDVLEDALFELAWTHVARRDIPSALRSIELFLLSFPDTAAAGRMTLVRGHLLMQQTAWEDATVAYAGIDGQFIDIEDQLKTLSSDELVDLVRDPAQSPLPGWVVSQLAGDTDVKRAADLWTGLEQSRTDLAEADATAAELELSLDSGIELQRHRRLRRGLFGMLGRIGRGIASICSANLDAIGDVDREGRARAKAIAPQLRGMEQRLADLQSHEDVATGRQSAVPKMLEAVGDLRKLAAETRLVHDDPAHAAIDSIVIRLDDAWSRTQQALTSLDAEAIQTAGPLREQLIEHQEELAVLHLAHNLTEGISLEVRDRAVRVGVGRVGRILDDGIREARAGLGDATFASLLDQVAAREALQVEREERLERLRRLFATARARQ